VGARAFDRLDCSEDFRRLNFQEAFRTVPQPRGGERTVREIRMTKDGFMFLVMGFTGMGVIPIDPHPGLRMASRIDERVPGGAWVRLGDLRGL
jgi:hypothetical protein